MNHPKSILKRHGLSSKLSLGQHFLHDESILNRLVASANINNKDTVLEIGPGLGSLTQHLIRVAGSVVTVELDARLVAILQDTFRAVEGLIIIHDDILEWKGLYHLTPGYKVVANVPYYITGGILRRLLEIENRPSILVLTVQKEVAERLCARPGKMSLLSTAVQLFGTVEIVFSIKPGAFWPPPEVESAVIRISTYSSFPVPANDMDELFRLIRTGFAHKRKMLKKNLAAAGYSKSELQRAFDATRISGKLRAQELATGDWIRLHHELS